MSALPTATGIQEGVSTLAGACAGTLGVLAADGPSLVDALPARSQP